MAWASDVSADAESVLEMAQVRVAAGGEMASDEELALAYALVPAWANG